MKNPLRLFALTALMLLAASGALKESRAQSATAPQVIAEGVEIALSSEWRVSSRKQIAQFEAARDQALAQGNLRPSMDPKEVVTFQAETGSGTNQAFIGITFNPVGEASQEQVARYSAERVQNLGNRLIEQHRRALQAVRCTGVSFSAPALVEVGGKKAIGFTVEFTTPDGIPRTGAKQYVYMRRATVILTSAAPTEAPMSLRSQLSNGLAGLRLSD